jgi:ribosomal-protein-alanine N-acetyltransferase
MAAFPLRYEAFSAAHLPAVLLLESQAYPDPWTQGMYRHELETPCSHLHVGMLGDELVAYAGFWLVLDEAHITRVTVAEEYRRRGYGRQVVEHLLGRAFALGAALARLEVREGNTAAIRLYERLGFVPEGLRPGYYQRTGEDAVLMIKRF